MDPAAGYKFVYQDHLGSTRMLSNADLQRDYYPYGEAKNASGNDDMPYQFSGKELDSGIGLYYFGARYYNPEIGRWLVPDPAGQGFSPYVYCGNSPLNYIDPNGMLFGIDDLIIIGIALGAWQGGAIANDWDYNPTHWHFNKGSTWFGMVAGGAIGRFAGGGLSYSLNHGTPMILKAFGIPVMDVGAGGAGFYGLKEMWDLPKSSANSFTLNIDLQVSVSFPGHTYQYEDVPITYYNIGPNGLHYLPDGSYFSDPETGGPLWINIENFVGSASSDVPFYLDPVNYIAGGVGTINKLGKIGMGIYPKKMGPWGQMRAFDPKTGLYVNYSKTLAGQLKGIYGPFFAGFGQGFSNSYFGTDMSPSLSGYQRWGQIIGQGIGGILSRY